MIKSKIERDRTAVYSIVRRGNKYYKLHYHNRYSMGVVDFFHPDSFNTYSEEVVCIRFTDKKANMKKYQMYPISTILRLNGAFLSKEFYEFIIGTLEREIDEQE